ncbi:hypothetical protein OIU76_005663 [Salix suchowensis]|nr:hypothetical protein OIU77_010490 [Salix suchowensis]KAJ6343966.1 hypothetical protein OIU76_005663 [Salix suchowensis]
MLWQELSSFGVSNMSEIVSHLVTLYICHSFLGLLKAAFISFIMELGARNVLCSAFCKRFCSWWLSMSNEGTCRTCDFKEFSVEGILPASFKVLCDSDQEKETLLVDFGASAKRKSGTC